MLKRMTMSSVGGAAVSLGLGFAMMGMIAGEFKAKDKPPTLDFAINPQVDEPRILPDVKEPEPLREIETPPAPPPIEKVKAGVPQEPIATVSGARPDFKVPRLGPKDFVITVSDRDAQPIVRRQPPMPTRADRSGHCRMSFDVSAEGKPYNVVATYCTQSLFRAPSIKAVQGWNYHPKIQDGLAMSRQGVETRISYELLDARGNLIPE